jgi:predicted metalloprotease with PDZ domain
VISAWVVTTNQTIIVGVEVKTNNDTEEVAKVTNKSPSTKNGHSILDDSSEVDRLAVVHEVVLFIDDSRLIFMVVIHL